MIVMKSHTLDVFFQLETVKQELDVKIVRAYLKFAVGAVLLVRLALFLHGHQRLIVVVKGQVHIGRIKCITIEHCGKHMVANRKG